MTFDLLREFVSSRWTDGLEILLLAVGIYFTWRMFQGTPGANVFAGLIILFLGITLLSELLGLRVIGWIATRLSAVVIVAVLILFQPDLRRGLGALGSRRFFFLTRRRPVAVDQLTEITFELANRQLGALMALERSQPIDTFAQSGVPIDCALSPELAVSIFFPKTPLHDGGIVIREDRIVSAACIFPVSQKADLDRSLGLRHRAALGLTEETDAIVIVVSEETGNVSICHQGAIERDFDPASFKARLAELFLLKDEKTDSEQLAGEDRVAGARHRGLGGDQKERRDDPLAF